MHKTIVTSALVGILLGAGSAPAAGIGTATLYGQFVEIFAAEWEEKHAPGDPFGGGGGATKVEFGGFRITKAIDALTPQIFVDVATGKHFPEARIDLPPDAKKPVGVSYLLEDVLLVGSTIVKKGTT